MVQRKIGNSHTTICISWEDKEKFRRFAKFLKTTKHGSRYESDAQLFGRVLQSFAETHEPINDEAKPTYPFQGKSQQG